MKYNKTQRIKEQENVKSFQVKRTMGFIIMVAIITSLSIYKGLVIHKVHSRTIVHPERCLDETIGERLIITATDFGNFERGSKNNNRITTMSSFDVLCKLGSGRFGSVYKVKQKDGKDKKFYFALKVLFATNFQNTSMQFLELKNEFMIMKKGQSPFITKAHYLFRDSKQAYLVMQLMIPFDRIVYPEAGRFLRVSEDAIRFYMAEIILAVEQLYSKGIAHNDILPPNVGMNQDGHLTLMDFGISLDKHMCGKKTYLYLCKNEDDFHSRLHLDIIYLGALMTHMFKTWLDYDQDWHLSDSTEHHFTLPINLPHRSWSMTATDIRKISNDAKEVFSFFNDHNKEFIQGDFDNDTRNGMPSAEKYINLLKKQKFFSKINWNTLLKKQLTPPFNIEQIKKVINVNEMERDQIEFAGEKWKIKKEIEMDFWKQYGTGNKIKSCGHFDKDIPHVYKVWEEDSKKQP